jgi:ABC-type Mn2+/Zn2+ transport system permease subunit
LLFVTFDSEVASTYGVATGRIDVVFSLVLAAAIIATMRILGVTLIAAAIVTPAVVARLTCESFARMLATSVLVGAACGFGGMYVSYYGDIASGATITLFGAGVFAIVFLAGTVRLLLRGRPAGIIATVPDGRLGSSPTPMLADIEWP